MGQVQATTVPPADPYVADAWMQELRQVAEKVYAPLTRDVLVALREKTATYGAAMGVDRHLLDGLRVFISLFQLPEVPWQYGIGMQELFMAPSCFYTYRFDRIVNALLRADTPQALARVLESTDTMALVDSVCLLFAMQSTRCPLAMTVYRSTNGTEDLIPCVARVSMGPPLDIRMPAEFVSLTPAALVHEGFTLSTTMWANFATLTVDQGRLDTRPRPFGFEFLRGKWSAPAWARTFLAYSPLNQYTAVEYLLATPPESDDLEERLEAVRAAASAPHKWLATEMAAGWVWNHMSADSQRRISRSPTFKRRAAHIVAGLTEFLSVAVPTYLAAVAAATAAAGGDGHPTAGTMEPIGAALLRAWANLVFARVGMLLRRVHDFDATPRPGDCTVARPSETDTVRWRLEANGSIISLWEARARDVKRLMRTPLGHTATMDSFTSTSVENRTQNFGVHPARMHVGVGVHALPIFLTGSESPSEQELLLGPGSQALRVPASASDQSATAVFKVTPPSAAHAAAAHCCTDTELQPIANVKVALALAAMALPLRAADNAAQRGQRIKQVAAPMLGGDTDTALKHIRGVCIALLTRRAHAMFPIVHRAVVSRMLPYKQAVARRRPRVARLGVSAEAPARAPATKKRRRQLEGGGTSHLVDVWGPTFAFCYWHAVFEMLDGRALEQQVLQAIRSEATVPSPAPRRRQAKSSAGAGTGGGHEALARPPVTLYQRAHLIMAATAAEFAQRTTKSLPWYLTHVGNALLSFGTLAFHRVSDIDLPTCRPLEAWSQSTDTDARAIVASDLFLPWDGHADNRPLHSTARVLLPPGVPLRMLETNTLTIAHVRLLADADTFDLHVVPAADEDKDAVVTIRVTWRAAQAPRQHEPARTRTPKGREDLQVVRERCVHRAREVFTRRWDGSLWDDTKFHTDY